MRIPRRFQLAGTWWVVQYVRNLRDRYGNPNHGRCHPRTKTILLNTKLRDPTLTAVFLHELAHACFPRATEHQVEEFERIVRRLL